MASKMLHEHVRSTQASDAPIPGGSVAERRLECLEVWGGSSRLDDQVAVTGIPNWLNHIDSGDPGQLLPLLRAAPRIHEDGHERNDDLTLMLLRATGEQPPHQSLSEKLNVIARMMGILRV